MASRIQLGLAAGLIVSSLLCFVLLFYVGGGMCGWLRICDVFVVWPHCACGVMVCVAECDVVEEWEGELVDALCLCLARWWCSCV